VLVHRERDRRVGLVVDAVVDIVDWDGGEAAPRAGQALRIVIDDHVTDLVTLAGEAA